jgi:hypothetical protein
MTEVRSLILPVLGAQCEGLFHKLLNCKSFSGFVACTIDRGSVGSAFGNFQLGGMAYGNSFAFVL